MWSNWEGRRNSGKWDHGEFPGLLWALPRGAHCSHPCGHLGHFHQHRCGPWRSFSVPGMRREAGRCPGISPKVSWDNPKCSLLQEVNSCFLELFQSYLYFQSTAPNGLTYQVGPHLGKLGFGHRGHAGGTNGQTNSWRRPQVPFPGILSSKRVFCPKACPQSSSGSPGPGVKEPRDRQEVTWSHLCAEQQAQRAEPWENPNPPGLGAHGGLGGVLHLQDELLHINYCVGEGGKRKLSLGELCWQTAHESFNLVVLGSCK